ncbi:Omega-3 fatty acid desaturase protein [Thalictrum thalictroides]|uniref:Omega-3 fatty acid desaturase protein n=1 Tax=Thalictrum thalictroides TaxID=46969 RepID=A0A7J6W8B9_THATH|nr:Omega-3 fatty acid desaturase protein [Thalictrum thalictroides]
MESWFTSKCGLGLLSSFQKGLQLLTNPTTTIKSSKPSSNVNVNANGNANANGNGNGGKKMFKGEEGVVEGEDDGFDFSAAPPFKIADIRAAIPKHCWIKDPWKSMSYVFRDVIIVLLLAVIATYFDNAGVWAFYWVAQGTMFWAIFVLGHDW